jgi:hypothetical protein
MDKKTTVFNLSSNTITFDGLFVSDTIKIDYSKINDYVFVNLSEQQTESKLRYMTEYKEAKEVLQKIKNML